MVCLADSLGLGLFEMGNGCVNSFAAAIIPKLILKILTLTGRSDSFNIEWFLRHTWADSLFGLMALLMVIRGLLAMVTKLTTIRRL